MSAQKSVGHKKILYRVLVSLVVVTAFFAFFSAKWCESKYGNIGFDAVLFTIRSNLSGTSTDLVLNYLHFVLPSTAVMSALALFLLLFRSKRQIFLKIGKSFKKKIFPLGNRTSAFVSAVLCVALTVGAMFDVGIPNWMVNSLTDGKIFDEEYVYPNDTEISFSGEKRNLIYIYLESMETTFLSKNLGGALDYNVIPELYSLAKENVNFSSTNGVGGCMQISGATWTIGAMVAQTAGVPLKLPIDGNSYGDFSQFLPGITSITDILHNNGYYQMFLVGSDASFGGRSNYFSQHGVDEICDYYTAISDGIIEDGYENGWWGMEDKYVWEYAKEKLSELSQKDEPFSFFTLTTDTHHIGGYTCSLCDDKYEESYENAYACASKQLYDFIGWLKKQDFYENTTIVITGDHCSMDAEYMERNVSSDYERRIYNCFINSAVEPQKEKECVFSQFDMFPTTLAAIGAEIDGNRLGLGVNLFSGEQTLAEKYGFDELYDLVALKSKMYDNVFLYAKTS